MKNALCSFCSQRHPKGTRLVSPLRGQPFGLTIFALPRCVGYRTFTDRRKFRLRLPDGRAALAAAEQPGQRLERRFPLGRRPAEVAVQDGLHVVKESLRDDL